MDVRDLIKKNYSIHLSSTGALPGFAERIWNEPGASNVLVGSAFPYSRNEIDSYLGFDFKGQYCSIEAAIALASVSYFKAQAEGVDKEAIGVGASLAVQTSVKPRNGYRAYFAIRTRDNIFVSSLGIRELADGIDDSVTCGRARMNDYCSGYAYDFLAKVLEHDFDWHQDIKVRSLKEELSAKLKSCDLDKSYTVRFEKDEWIIEDTNEYLERVKTENVKNIIYPGSFNPVHYVHSFALNSLQRTGASVVCEMTTGAIDKGGSIQDIQSRVWQFAGLCPVILNHNVGLFVDKIKFYGDKFSYLLGEDTLFRTFPATRGAYKGQEEGGFENQLNNETELFHALGYKDIGFYVISRELPFWELAREVALISYDTPYGALPSIIPVQGLAGVSSTQFRNRNKDVK